MSPVTHLLISWPLANSYKISRKERALVTIAGISPDFDGLGIIADILTRHNEHPLHLWGKFHHILGHNIGFILIATFIVFCTSTRRWVAGSLAFLCLNIHMLCDLLGARGPDGYQWPIPYFLPFSGIYQFTWEGQWSLNAWPNFLLTGTAIVFVFYIAWKRGYSPVEILSTRADEAFVNTLRKRFGKPK
ncbi:MAG: metal-dependent hydrolase [Desulfobacterales bacterium]|nr:metal-dependent hydrolase [Desulfobacteraceae bacterium]MBT4364882.1 metal-dependent hydrolase [Desulfobacteraceae bacterium]MBT7086630.1 metal-dependent hydrolase [Desulfobacterales bacterium]MBT7698569.1 metal-dependent hydrolase [Desulfobacterales bacterium]